MFSSSNMAVRGKWFVACCTIAIVIDVGPVGGVPGMSYNALVALANTMNISVEVVDNLRNPRGHTTRLTIQNDGDTPISANGWTMYFHSLYWFYPRLAIIPEERVDLAKVEKINISTIHGDLFKLEPLEGFVPIGVNEKRHYDIKYLLWSVTKTDFMPNWYLTSQDPLYPTKTNMHVIRSTQASDANDLAYVKPFTNVQQFKRGPMDTFNPFTAQERWRRLHVENSGKIDTIIIPTPKSVSIHGRENVMDVDLTWKILKPFPESKGSLATAMFLADLTKLSIVDGKNAKKVISLKVDPNANDVSKIAGAYTVNILPYRKTHAIEVKARDDDGLFYGCQSLYSILLTYNFKDIPGIVVADEPRYSYRGMHIDVARNFHGVDEIKRLIEVMAMYKLNKLHMHLSDDEGWRLDIPALPELSQVGGARCHDLSEYTCILPQYGSGPLRKHNTYSVKDYQNILKQASKYHIQVIPEFDMPGHSHAAIKSMRRRMSNLMAQRNVSGAYEYMLHDNNDKSKYLSVQKWTDNAMNPCIPSTYKFIATIVDTLIALHKDIQPLSLFHFGGDQVPTGAWVQSASCKTFLKTNPAYDGNTKFQKKYGLKKYFVEMVSQHTAGKGLTLGAWEDGLMRGRHTPYDITKLDNKEVLAYAWNNVWEWGSASNAYKLANAGYKVVMSQAKSLYFDHPNEPDPEERGYYWATRYTDTLKVFSFLPDSLYDNIHEKLSGEPLTKYDVCGDDISRCEALQKKENIIGMQGQLWSETVRTPHQLDSMIFPRLLALAERAWHKAPFEEKDISEDEREIRLKSDWAAFANTLGHKELRRLDERNVLYRVPPPSAIVKNDQIHVSTTYPGLVIEHRSSTSNTWSIAHSNSWKYDGLTYLRTRSADSKRTSREILVSETEPLPSADQTSIDYMADNIKVNVTTASQFQEQLYVRMTLTLQNVGTRLVTAATWKLYYISFSSSPKIEDLECGLSTRQEAGILFYFTPTDANFAGIKPGQTLHCTYYNMNIPTKTSALWYFGAEGMQRKPVYATV